MQLNEDDQHIQCQTLYNLLIGGKAWDINVLYNIGASGVYPGNWSPATGSCRRTVTVEGRCYRASAVNYALWGRANSICHFAAQLYQWRKAGFTGPLDESPDYGIGRAVMWAKSWKEFVHRDHDIIPETEQFTRWGYGGASGLTLAGKAGCPGSSEKVKDSEFSWYWLPKLNQQPPKGGN